jgi:GMP synthase (glutamine-hydrolysing)
MGPLLVIDCYVEGDGAKNYRRLLPDRVLESWRPSDGPATTSATAFDGIMITGSAACVTAPEPWMAGVIAMLQDAQKNNVPVLGICFGHQILAAAAFGMDAVQKSATPEIGWFDVRIGSEGSALCEGLDDSFTTFMSHFDEVVPCQGMSVFASTTRCRVAGYRVDGHRMWGIQFHPEMAQDEAEELTVMRIEGRPDLGFDLDATLARSCDSTHLVNQILSNFLSAH